MYISTFGTVISLVVFKFQFTGTCSTNPIYLAIVPSYNRSQSSP